MNDPELAARLIEALNEAAGAGAALVSVEITLLARAEIARIETQTARRTRTLVFQSAEALAANGQRIARAASVHKTS